MSTMKLPIELTDGDRLTVSADLTTIITALEKVEAEKKEVNRDFNTNIKTHKAQIHELNESLRTGLIDREVEVEERSDYLRGVVETFRLDTNTIVKTRGIDPDERQLKLSGDIKDAIASDGPATEEQIVATTPEEAEEMRQKRIAAEKAERDREERLGFWLDQVAAKILVLPIGDAEDGQDRFKAEIGKVDGYGWEILSVTGQDEQEAVDALREQLIEQWKLVDEKAETARQERILTRLGELLKSIKFDADGSSVLATIETVRWKAQSIGKDHEDAAWQLRAKMIEILTAEDAEIVALAKEQAHDRAKDGPRHKLKAPAGMKKRKGKSISVEVDGKTLTGEDLEAAGSDKPPTDDPPPAKDGDEPAAPDGLAF